MGFGALDRMLLRELARLFVATLGGVVLLYLVIDFADRGSIYFTQSAAAVTRGAWARAVVELYANKAAVVAHQLAPAALIIAAALLVTQLSRRGELTALQSLGVSPLRLCLPVALFAALLAAGLVVLQERLVVNADARTEEIMARVFNRWSDYFAWHAESSWVRGREGRIFRLGPPAEGGFQPVTVLEIGAPFRLARRIDARRLEPAGPGRWRLFDAVDRRFAAPGEGPAEASITELRSPELLLALPDTLEELSLRNGRPRQLRWGALREQAARRERLGQPAREYQVTIAERAASSFLVVPAALASVGLTLSRGRRRAAGARPLPAALALGIGLSLGLWALTVVLHAAAVGGSIAPWLAGAGPSLGCAILAAATLR